MRYVKFQIKEDYDSGITGVVPNIFSNWPNYMPSGSYGLAHDLLEHGTREVGSFDQELAALGGYLFVRDFGNFHSTMNSVAINLASGMARSYQESTIDHIRTPPVTYGLTNDELEELNEFLPGFREALIKDWENEILEYDFDNYDDPDNSHPYTDENWPLMIGWIKYGFIRAKRRYGNKRWMAWKLRRAIEKVFDDSMMQQLEEYKNTGEEFTLTLDIEKGEAKITHKLGLVYKGSSVWV